METEINEPINLIAQFKNGQTQPLAFRWQNKNYQIDKINLRYQQTQGKSNLIYFSVNTQAGVYILMFDQQGLTWKIHSYLT